ncbi:MAG: hypothetical protein KIT09_35360 [Bryobacteraceae bacterium]|nr:hypothetical protein [Bryobacteraceae bacterium]
MTSAFLFAGPLALAQRNTDSTEPHNYSGHGYAFWSLAKAFDDPGKVMAFGGGGEGFLYRGLSLGGELAYLFPTESPTSGIGMASVNPAYHFLNRRGGGKLVPFVTGGYSLGFRGGVGHFFNYGGGATYWFSRKVGLRLELRDYRYASNPRENLLTFRVGASFR